VDWGGTDILAVGLGTCVYLWNATTSKVTKLCDLGPADSVTSVSWTQRGSHVAVGTNNGSVLIWDAEKCRKLRTMSGHTSRVGKYFDLHHRCSIEDRLISGIHRFISME
jgi:cell division cycle 20-like protein 1 (cofactor of APC complex)